jgi:hypothetical protein
MSESSDLTGIVRLLERLFNRAGLHSRVWIVGWLASIMAVATVAVIYAAPTVIYLLLLVVALIAVGAGHGMSL